MQNNNIEQSYVLLSLDSLILLIGAVYIPPQSDIDVYNTHTDTVNNLLIQYYNSKIILLGDYNLPGIHWSVVENNIVPNSFKYSNLETNVLANISFLNLQQFNTIINRKNGILDLILSNSTNILVLCETDPFLPIDYMYHPTLLVTFPIIVYVKPLQCNELINDFSLCSYNVIKSELASIDWPVVFNDLCINRAVNNFYTIIFKIVDNNNCTKKHAYISKYPVWFSSMLKDLVYKKKIAHKLYKLSPTQINYNIFSNLCAQCKLQSKADYRKYITGTQNSLSSNRKKFWQFLKNKPSNSSLPTSYVL